MEFAGGSILFDNSRVLPFGHFVSVLLPEKVGIFRLLRRSFGGGDLRQSLLQHLFFDILRITELIQIPGKRSVMNKCKWLSKLMERYYKSNGCAFSGYSSCFIFNGAGHSYLYNGCVVSAIWHFINISLQLFQLLLKIDLFQEIMLFSIKL